MLKMTSCFTFQLMASFLYSFLLTRPSLHRICTDSFRSFNHAYSLSSLFLLHFTWVSVYPFSLHLAAYMLDLIFSPVLVVFPTLLIESNLHLFLFEKLTVHGQFLLYVRLYTTMIFQKMELLLDTLLVLYESQFSRSLP